MFYLNKQSIAFSKFDNVIATSFEMCIYDDWDEKLSNQWIIKQQSIASIKNYIFINCQNHIIGIHPTNPTFDYLLVAENINNNNNFCNSRKYGTFYISNNGRKILQSGKYTKNRINVIYDINKDKCINNKNIISFNNCLYDENYGISGRLMVFCKISQNNRVCHTFFQLFNKDELLLLKQEIKKINDDSQTYYNILSLLYGDIN